MPNARVTIHTSPAPSAQMPSDHRIAGTSSRGRRATASPPLNDCAIWASFRASACGNTRPALITSPPTRSGCEASSHNTPIITTASSPAVDAETMTDRRSAGDMLETSAATAR